MSRILWLGEIEEADRPAVGEKAFTLARLRRAGLPVPDGFVVESADEQALAAAFARLGPPVAVRSSSTAEDSAETSFAGQHRTLLDVRTQGQLREAVALSRASSAAAYASVLRVAEGRVRVLVQRFVEPRVAGVAFTEGPAGPHTIVVESHAGRGEAVVGGRVSPDRYVVDRSTRAPLDAPAGGSLEPTALDAVVALALRAEELLGAPQDVEWAIGAEGLVLLQSRPITVEAVEARDPRIRRLTRANVGEVLPDPVTPLTWTTLGAFLEHAFRAVAERAGILPVEAPAFLTLHHRRLYLNLDLCAEVAGQLPGVSPVDAERLILGGGATARSLARIGPSSFPALVRVGLRLLALAADLPREIAAAEENARGRIADGAGTSERAALAHRLEAFAAAGRAVAFAHVAVSGACAFRLALLGRLLESCAPGGDTVDRVNRLVAGLAEVESAAPVVALEELAALARQRPDWSAWLGDPQGREPPDALAARLHLFLERFGHRGLSEGELSAPAWMDDPAPVLAALRTRIVSPRSLDLARGAAAELRAADEEALLSRLGPLRRAWMRAALVAARAGVREREHTKSLAVALMNHGRRLARAASRALALPREDDVFFLELAELLRVLRGEAVSNLRQSRRRRRHEREGALPAPREVDLASPDEAVPAASGHGPSRRGLGVSPGVGLGPARVLHPAETPSLEPGEVLVTPTLDAALGPALVSAAGVVAETGGLLSHGAVVARELGVPCVVDVGDATRWLRTGDRVLVDGRTGLVRREVDAARETDAALLAPEDETDERLHPLASDALARESVYLNARDPGSGLALVASLGVKPGDRGEALVALSFGEGRVLFGLEREKAHRLDRGLAVGGLQATWNPVRFRAHGRLADHQEPFPPGPLALLLSPRTRSVEIDLAFEPATPAFDLAHHLEAEARDAMSPLGSYHLEQSGRWRGEITLDGARIPISGTGSRDHSRGRRDWDAADHWRLFALRLGDDLALHALVVSVRGRLVEGGFLWREGRAEAVRRVLYAARRQDGRVRSLTLEVTAAGGTTLRVEGTVERTLVVPVQAERRPGRHLAGRPYRLLLHENFTRFEAEGRAGYGIAEFTERPA